MKNAFVVHISHFIMMEQWKKKGFIFEYGSEV